MGKVNSRCGMVPYRTTCDSLCGTRKDFSIFMRLRSAVGERGKCSAGGETAGTKPERNAAAEPQTEVIPHPVLCRMVCDLGRFDWAPGFPRCGIKRRLVRAL